MSPFHFSKLPHWVSKYQKRKEWGSIIFKWVKIFSFVLVCKWRKQEPHRSKGGIREKAEPAGKYSWESILVVFSRCHLPEIEFKILAVGLLLVLKWLPQLGMEEGEQIYVQEHRGTDYWFGHESSFLGQWCFLIFECLPETFEFICKAV